ncbi:MAG: NAD(P)/FAD-dependent oxidoreductase [Anaerolineaceae bacterium]|nr:NAD(P)/FAD-dependent oxidoreductase [Anaerolineaceae bacterium]
MTQQEQQKIVEMDAVVIGGGPAGFFAAIRLAKACPGLRIVIIEKGEKVLQKVYVSGGGRCNLTHQCDDPRELVQSYPRGGRSLTRLFYQFGPADTIRWFNQHQVHFYVDEEGCFFPSTNTSQTIIDCLVNAAEELGIHVWTRASVIELLLNEDEQNRFTLVLEKGNPVACRTLLMATGGNRKSLRLAARLGHPIESPVPSLFPFVIEDERIADLSGIVIQDVLLGLPQTKIEARGDLLFTHRGISGPAVIRLSSWGARVLAEANYQHPLWVNWIEEAGNAEQVYEKLMKIKEERAVKLVSTQDPFEKLPQRLWQHLVSAAQIPAEMKWSDGSKKQIRALAEELARGIFQIQARDHHKQEFVTCGGVSLRSVDMNRLESQLIEGLFFAGEMLDVDGLTGGYNLQHAWTSGWVAGGSMAERHLQA